MRGLGSVFRRAVVLTAALLFIGVNLPPCLRAQGHVVDQKQFDIVIQSANVLRLRVGSTGSQVDRVTFQVGIPPGAGSVQGVSSGPNPVPVVAEAVQLSGQMRLTADSSTPLGDGSGNQIPFTEIGWTGGGGVPSGLFSGSSNQLILATSQSSISGSMAFFYSNVGSYPAGVYTGRVTYTLSSP